MNNKEFQIKLNQKFNEYSLNEGVVAVAVSGGSDSMALLLSFKEFINSNKFSTKIVAITVNHNLRTESVSEAMTVSQWCSKINIKHYILSWNFAIMPNTAIQEKCRNIRYKLISNFCKINYIKKVLFAHNLEDNAETFLMHLKRGSGIKGLSSIPSKLIKILDDNFNLEIYRPFLSFKRNDLKKYLMIKNQKFINDPSNINKKYERTKVRNFLSNIDYLNNEYISKSVIRLNNANEALMYYANIFWNDKIYLLDYCIAKINIYEFSKLPYEIKLIIFDRLIWSIGSQKKPIRRQKLEYLLIQIEKNYYKGCYCLGNCLIIFKKKYIWIGYEDRSKYITKFLKYLSLKSFSFQGRLIIDNEQEINIKICYLYNYLELINKFLIEHKSLINCPKKILKTLPIAINDKHQILSPRITKKNNNYINIKLNLKIRY